MLGGAGSNMRGRPFGGGAAPGMGASVTEDMMHQENDDSISRLSDRVRGLKEVRWATPTLAVPRARRAAPLIATC
jgi:hypothetical protein